MIKKINDIKILDCTLRDGGYYNNWEFPRELVADHLSVMSSCGVDVVELGFRTLSNNSYKGPLAYTTDKYLESIEWDQRDLKVSVMVNAKELSSNLGSLETIRLLFPLLKSKTKVLNPIGK